VDVKKNFFYSQWDTPDSIELYAETLIPLLIHREYYLINSHGDPIRDLIVAGSALRCATRRQEARTPAPKNQQCWIENLYIDLTRRG
jgi:hypothetical protein